MGEEMKNEPANVVSLISGADPAAKNGRVISVDEDQVSVRIDDAIVEARPAFSCLVRPRPRTLSSASGRGADLADLEARAMIDRS